MSPDDLNCPQIRQHRREYGELGHSTGFLISVAQAHVHGKFFDDLSRHGLRPGQISALILIRENPGIRHGELAEMLVFKLSYMTKLVKSFEAEGWVQRRISDSDRRAVELSLTEDGETYVAKMAPLLFQHDKNRPSGLDKSETEALVRLLRKHADIPE